MSYLQRFIKNKYRDGAAQRGSSSFANLSEDQLESHMQIVRYGRFNLTNAVRPSYDLQVVPKAGFRHDKYRDEDTGIEIPVVMASVSREEIIDIFFEMHGHLSVEDVWSRVRQDDPRVSVATVYRTMKLLSESGLAHARNFGDGQTRYEPAVGREHHDHLICTRCGAIIEFENDQIERMQDAVARRHGFKVTSHKMELYGLCKSCQKSLEQGA